MNEEKGAPLVSVVIPCYNQGHYVGAAVDSVLASDLQDLEIIVVNDGSTDARTIAVLERLDKRRTRVLHQTNQGASSARNHGFRQARGNYVLPLDADDQIHPTYLRKAVTVLEADPRLGFAFAHTVTFGLRQVIWKRPEYNLYRELWRNRIPVSSVVRKTAWQDAGGYNPNLSGYEDWDLWIGLGERGWFGKLIPEPLCYYRTQVDSKVSRSHARHGELVERIRRNHPATFGDPARLRELRREWGIPSIDIDWLQPLRKVWRARWFPGSVKRLIRPVPGDVHLMPDNS